MVAGEYTESALPNYMESRYGTYRFPIIIQAADGPLTTRFHGYLNIYDTRYLYLIGLNLVTDPGFRDPGRSAARDAVAGWTGSMGRKINLRRP